MLVANLFAMLFIAPITNHLLTLIVISAAAQCFLGALWYGVIFKRSWMKLIGLARDEKPKYQGIGVVATFIGCFLLSFVLAYILGWAGPTTATDGVAIGIVCWFGFMGPPLLVQHVFENRPANLLAINACYWLVAMALGGAIMAAFH
jgi:glucan phosphoethanolaminetransferase (alkaline phosphatase superfamily)